MVVAYRDERAGREVLARYAELLILPNLVAIKQANDHAVFRGIAGDLVVDVLAGIIERFVTDTRISVVMSQVLERIIRITIWRHAIFNAKLNIADKCLPDVLHGRPQIAGLALQAVKDLLDVAALDVD